MRFVSCFVQHISKLSRRTAIHSPRLQFIRCESIVAEKLVYSEYGDAVKVIRQEKEKLPAPKDSEVSNCILRGFIGVRYITMALA
jgi:hypothetical protein